MTALRPVRGRTPAAAADRRALRPRPGRRVPGHQQRPVPAGALPVATARGSITVVGDEDQSIYRWRGADIRNILDFERDHPGARVVKLERNYRSTGNILRAANAIIEKNSERRPKRLYTEEGDGERIILFEGETERDEAEFVASRDRGWRCARTWSPRDFAVFYRTNAQSRVLEDAMRARDISLRRRRRHALLRPRRDQGPHLLPARDRQPRRRAGAAADHQHPRARHRRQRRRSTTAVGDASV